MMHESQCLIALIDKNKQMHAYMPSAGFGDASGMFMAHESSNCLH